MKFGRQARRLWRRAWFRAMEVGRALTSARHSPRQVAFIHVMKTGGSSISYYFKEFIGSSRSGRIVSFDEFLSDEPLGSCIERARKARYVAGHYSWASLDSFRTPDTYVFTFMRDPYDRLRSLYYYFRNFPPGAKGVDEIRRFSNLSMEEFMTSDDPSLRFYTDNFMVRQFSGKLSQSFSTPEELDAAVEAAISNLSTLDHIGFHHRFESDFRTIVRAVGLPVPRRSPRINVTVKTTIDAGSSRRQLSERERSLAYPLIAGDLRIYDHFLEKATRNDPRG